MTRTSKTLVGLALSSGLALVIAASHAQTFVGNHGMGPGMMGGMPGGMAHQLMTPQEHDALMEKMRNAKTAEERQKIAMETRSRMQQRAKEQGIPFPDPVVMPPVAPNAGTTK